MLYLVKLLICSCFLLLITQQASVAASHSQYPPLAAHVVVAPDSTLPADSMYQAVHRVFKWGRRLSWVTGVAGVMAFTSGIIYTARGKADWFSTENLILGSISAYSGVQGVKQFSRRRERQVLAGLQQGQPVPQDIALWLTRSKRKP